MIIWLNGKAQLKGDHWVPIWHKGKKDYMQIGDVKHHFPGKTHNKIWGFPKWGK